MIAKEQLKSIVSRIEKLTEEKDAIADDIKEVYAEAKANGFDVKTLRTVIRRHIATKHPEFGAESAAPSPQRIIAPPQDRS